MVLKENQVLEINQIFRKTDQRPQEMERKKVLVLKENQVLEINQNLIVKTDHKDHQEMERKKVLVLKENQVLQKKIISKPSGFTNNPKYFGKKPSENSSSDA